MKNISQMDAIKSIRKPIPPFTKIERPMKGGGYRRHPKNKKDLEDCGLMDNFQNLWR
jgi:hypothetical protein